MEFLNSSIEITIANPKGGVIPIDPRSNPTPVQAQTWQAAIEAGKHTVQLSAVQFTEFDAIFLPGGHDPIFDLISRIAPLAGSIVASIRVSAARLIQYSSYFIN